MNTTQNQSPEAQATKSAQTTGPTAAKGDTGAANSGSTSGRDGGPEGRSPTGAEPERSGQDPGTMAQKAGGEPLPRMPHERDESHQSQHTGARPVGRQAASDLERGLEETDLYGSRGQRQPRGPAGGDAND
ncbi:hypothetical protein [Cupriavidus sp. AU9028]|uniref:hypothetical protein n=1 Tax=Cupriavidus sp. AU9028 TaxID=2871157 RepID=UPI001C967719|nr:hypothetical protein [Cupriavidus sp. AU9028]MBY4898405.1 hypothetical protein [Cupriavidus sp. AU9028]